MKEIEKVDGRENVEKRGLGRMRRFRKATGRFFSSGPKSLFWRWTVCLVSLSIVCFFGTMSVLAYREIKRDRDRSEYYNRIEVGEDYYYMPGSNGNGYIYERHGNKKILKGIDWIAKSKWDRNMIVYSQKGKRGYFNTETGNVAIEPKYDAAWCFRDSVAAVCIGDSVFFIDHKGHPINSRRYLREKGREYFYVDGLFAESKDGKYALVDKKGENVTDFLYDNIKDGVSGYWVMEQNGLFGILDSKGEELIPARYNDLAVSEENGLVATLDNNSKIQLDYEGNVLNPFVFDRYINLSYPSGYTNTEGETSYYRASADAYGCNGHYGLVKDGKPVTPPLYKNIEASGETTYNCYITDDDMIIIEVPV
ncbi:MAG: WG repeat-containing protein [Muribaculaceae bacterium]|nr:WG repeat-containing protein [Muribaculaceae bacterium]